VVDTKIATRELWKVTSSTLELANDHLRVDPFMRPEGLQPKATWPSENERPAVSSE